MLSLTLLYLLLLMHFIHTYVHRALLLLLKQMHCKHIQNANVISTHVMYIPQPPGLESNYESGEHAENEHLNAEATAPPSDPNHWGGSGGEASAEAPQVHANSAFPIEQATRQKEQRKTRSRLHF